MMTAETAGGTCGTLVQGRSCIRRGGHIGPHAASADFGARLDAQEPNLLLPWVSPVGAGSAGLNGAYFFACPLCGACVLDMEFSNLNRHRHEAFHIDGPADG